MKPLNRVYIYFLSLFISLNILAVRKTGSNILVGKVPAPYFGIDDTYGILAEIVIKDGIIKSLKKVDSSESSKKKAESLNLPLLELKNKHGVWDIIYPGLIDLHNHNNQNVMHVWEGAHGRFANRFEWRKKDKWGYKQGVKLNMNPWYGGLKGDLGFKQFGLCATTRWSLLQSMVLGTTVQQADIKCNKGFGIPSLKTNDVVLYTDKKKKLSAPMQPGDLVYPDDMPVLWQHLQGTTDFPKDFYEKIVKHYCPEVVPSIEAAYAKSKKDWPVVLQPEVLKLKFFNKSKSKKIVDTQCLLGKEKKNFKSFRSILNNGVFKGIANRLRKIESKKFSSLITHLSEGRRHDPYNQLEIKLLEIMGFAREHVNIIHGVGVSPEEYKNIMAKNKMGLIWSPASNFILYNQTADILEAFKAYQSTGDQKIRIALGSDWTPTGTKTVLHEVKLARNYLKKIGQHNLINDYELYKMMTENSARMLNYLESDPNDGIHGIGTIKKDATATLIVVRQRSGNDEDYNNVFTNLVTAGEEDINLVMIQGRPLYGEIPYLKSYNNKIKYETLPGYYDSVNSFFQKKGQSKIPMPPKDHNEKDESAFWEFVFGNNPGRRFSKFSSGKCR